MSLCKSLQATPDEQMHLREDYILFHNSINSITKLNSIRTGWEGGRSSKSRRWGDEDGRPGRAKVTTKVIAKVATKVATRVATNHPSTLSLATGLLNPSPQLNACQ
jgi:hypothetical protein